MHNSATVHRGERGRKGTVSCCEWIKHANTWHGSLMSTEVIVTVTPGIIVSVFYLRDEFSHRGREELAAKRSVCGQK